MKKVFPILPLLLLLCACAAPAQQPQAEAPPPAAVPAAPAAPAEAAPPPSSHSSSPADKDPEEEEEDSPAVTTVPAEVPAPQRLDSLIEEPDGLCCVQPDGTYLKDGSVGYLYFGEDGRYTTGDAELDAQVEQLLAQVTDPMSDRETRLRQIYDYIRDHYDYLGVQHYEAGSTEWMNEAASFLLKNGKSNCYGFAALFGLCARRLGYQAYVVAGYEYEPDNAHAWTMIDWPDGETYLFDPQLEYAYLYIYEDLEPIDMFKQSGTDGLYNEKQYYFP